MLHFAQRRAAKEGGWEIVSAIRQRLYASSTDSRGTIRQSGKQPATSSGGEDDVLHPDASSAAAADNDSDTTRRRRVADCV